MSDIANPIDDEISDNPAAAKRSVAIVGGGLAGLACAKQLASLGTHEIALFEASDRIGGRVRTDVIDGLKIDHGFQVLLTAYPACQELLDYDSLRLRSFEPGALVRHQGRFVRLGDPWRRPGQAISTLMSPVGSFRDKLRIAKVRLAASRGSLSDLYDRKAEPTEDRLRSLGFSESMINDFFRPFLGGVFLDESLETSSRMFEFVFRMFSAGPIAIPADGMAAIARQLSEALPRGTIRFNQTVASLEHGDHSSEIVLTDGSRYSADVVVIATESNAAARLLHAESLATDWNEAVTMYFEAPKSPESSKLLMLRGDETGPIQTAVVLSDIAPEYATRDRSLISISVSDHACGKSTDELETQVLAQAREWFGDVVDAWQLVQTIRVPYGLPKLNLDPVAETVCGDELPGIRLPSHVFVCGDHRETPSIQGAMNSGIRAAEQIIARCPQVH